MRSKILYKKFDKKLYQENDLPAKEECKLLFNQFGYKILPSPEAYKAWDFLVEKNNKTLPVEIDRKSTRLNSSH